MAEVITIEELLAQNPLDQSVYEQASGITPLAREDAIELLLVRLAGERSWTTGGQGASQLNAERNRVRNVAEFIVNALPEDLLEDTIIQQLDVRPWLDAMRGKEIQVGNARFVVPEETLDSLKQSETDKLREALLGMVSTQGGTLEERRKRVDEMLASPSSTVVLTSQMVTAAAEDGVPSVADGTAARANAAVDIDPTISVDELRKAFIRSYSSDILDLEAIGYEMAPDGTSPDVWIDMSPTKTKSPAAYYEQRASNTATGERLNVRAAIDYLYSGQLTPKEINTMQRRMVAAGFFDSPEMQGGYVPGDAFDDNTNRAWRSVLAQAFTREISIDDVLRESAQQRRQRLPDLTRNINRSVFNATAQNVIGRNLTDAEQEGVIAYIQNLQQEQGLAAADPALGYDPAALTEYMTDEFKGEMDRVGGIVGSNNFITAMKGL